MQYSGTGVAIVTPFNEDETVDFNALSSVINHLIEGGVDYIVTLGTTGETATLNTSEQEQVVKHTLKTVAGRLPVVVGCGGNNTSEVIRKMTMMETWGEFDTFLSVSPYYNKPSQEGIYQHYKHIAEATTKNIILYNVPGRTAKNMEIDTTCRLANDFENIIAIKEASNSLDQSKKLVESVPENFVVISGDDDLIVDQMKYGFKGVITVVGNAYPKEWSSMINACLANDFQLGSKIFKELEVFTNLIFEENNPAGVKCAMNEMNLIQNITRLPVVPVNQELDGRLRSFVKNNN